MKRRFVLLLMLLAAAPAAAQTDEVVRAALYLTGADSPEELDDRLVDELESFRNRPLPLNRASRARLLDSGLLTPYQVAALAEYRSLSGDVAPSFPWNPPAIPARRSGTRSSSAIRPWSGRR